MEPARLILSAPHPLEAGEFAEELDQSFSALGGQEDVDITELATMLNQCHLKQQKGQIPVNDKRHGPWATARASNADLHGVTRASLPSQGQLFLQQSRGENTSVPHLVPPPLQPTLSKNLPLLKDPVFTAATKKRSTVKSLVDRKKCVSQPIGEASKVDMDDYDDFLHPGEGVWIPKYIPTPPPMSPDTSNESGEEDVVDLRKKRIRIKY